MDPRGRTGGRMAAMALGDGVAWRGNSDAAVCIWRRRGATHAGLHQGLGSPASQGRRLKWLCENFDVMLAAIKSLSVTFVSILPDPINPVRKL